MKRPLIFIIFSCIALQGCLRKSPEQGEQDSLVRAGDRVQATGDYSSAINVYKSALEKNPPDKLPIYLKLGEAYMNAGRLDEAKKLFEEALAVDENDEAKKQLGRLYIATGQPDEALSIFEGVILVHKNDLKSLNGIGVAHDIKGEHPIAQDYYRRALAINVNNIEVKSNLGLSLAFEGKYAEALKLLQPIGEELSATSKQRHNLALVYALSGNKAKAQEIFAKDLDAGQINENIHALQLVQKPQFSPKPESKLTTESESKK